MLRSKFLLFLTRYGFFLTLIFTLAIAIIMTQNHAAQNKRAAYFEKTTHEQFAVQSELLRRQFAEQTKLLLEQFAEYGELLLEQFAEQSELLLEQFAEQDTLRLGEFAEQTELLQKTGHSIAASLVASTDEIIHEVRIGASINMQPAASDDDMQLVLDSLFMQSVLIDIEQEATALFLAGRYAQASAHFLTVSNAQPENFEARFFYFYSLFRNNRMDRGNYPRIREGLLALERHGFIRAEIRTVLEFIEQEEWRDIIPEAQL